jgi:hypothetical protein
MAIQVSGTTVIDDSRVLSNVTGLKTVGGTAILGSGDIAVGGSTTFGDVGTYTWGIGQTLNTFYLRGATIAGSSLRPACFTYGGGGVYGDFTSPGGAIMLGSGSNQSVLSGTWRIMGETQQSTLSDSDYPTGLWIRTV